MDAMSEIRMVAKMMLENPWISSPREIPVFGSPRASVAFPSLPVNMLRPLLMFGVEVEEQKETTWDISCIKCRDHSRCPPKSHSELR
jgi:hypothetical protein